MDYQMSGSNYQLTAWTTRCKIVIASWLHWLPDVCHVVITSRCVWQVVLTSRLHGLPDVCQEVITSWLHWLPDHRFARVATRLVQALLLLCSWITLDQNLKLTRHVSGNDIQLITWTTRCLSLVCKQNIVCAKDLCCLICTYCNYFSYCNYIHDLCYLC